MCRLHGDSSVQPLRANAEGHDAGRHGEITPDSVANLQPISQRDCTGPVPSRRGWDSCGSTSPAGPVASLLELSHSGGCVVVSHCCSSGHFPDDTSVFSCARLPCTSPLVTCLCRSWPRFSRAAHVLAAEFQKLFACVGPSPPPDTRSPACGQSVQSLPGAHCGSLGTSCVGDKPRLIPRSRRRAPFSLPSRGPVGISLLDLPGTRCVWWEGGPRHFHQMPRYGDPHPHPARSPAPSSTVFLPVFACQYHPVWASGSL